MGLGPLPAVANTLRLGFTGTISTSPWFCGWFLKYSGASLDTTALNAMCSTWGNIWVTNFSPLYVTSTALRQVEAWDLSSAAGAYGSAPFNAPGTLSGGGFSHATAQCITLKVNYRWRGGHPRMYLPPPSSDKSSGGNLWTPDHVTTVTAAARAFLAGMNASTSGGTTFQSVAVRYISNQVYLQPPLPLPIADAIFHSRIDSQRRRLGKETY